MVAEILERALNHEAYSTHPRPTRANVRSRYRIRGCGYWTNGELERDQQRPTTWSSAPSLESRSRPITFFVGGSGPRGKRPAWLTFRRTYSSWAHDKGLPPKVVAALMGHCESRYDDERLYAGPRRAARDAASRVGSELARIVQTRGGTTALADW